jgi:hypothetical protein
VLLGLTLSFLLAPPDSLSALAATLQSLRGGSLDLLAPARGATPQFTAAKHELRDWIESRLPAPPLDPDQLALTLNAELRAAGLFCGEEASSTPCPQFNTAGFLAPITVRWVNSFLVVQTGLDIICGSDDSAYLYEWKDSRWQRLWESERNTYTEKGYDPQTLTGVQVAGNPVRDGLYVVTLGHEWWCSSNWHRVYLRLWHVKSGEPPRLVLDRTRPAYFADMPPIRASLTGEDLLVQYTVGSIDGGVHSRKVVEHYHLTGPTATRIPPVALRPIDFIDEWVKTEWVVSQFWTEPIAGGSFLAAHRRYSAKDAFPDGAYFDRTQHCPATPDRYQVQLGPAYFLVRWRPPYNFTLLDVATRPWPACNQPAPNADAKPLPLIAPERY